MLVLVVMAGGATWILTGAVRRYALAKSMLDVPNDRSSHAMPTARGGGLAIAVMTLGGIAILGAMAWISSSVAVALFGGGVVVAVTGWIDDRVGVAAGVRGLVHLGAAGWAVYWLSGLQTLQIGWMEVPLGFAGSLLAVLGIVWAINSYNFMDGIDGLAAVEGVSVGLFGGLLLLAGGEAGLAAVAFVVAAASGGFLPWNWAPAKIFMGDAGSGLLGFLFGTLAVASEKADAVPVLVWVLLLAVFVFDSTVTLARRVYRRERWYEAHKSHAYQRAVQAGRSHASTTVAVIGINVAFGIVSWITLRAPALLLPTLMIGVAALTWLYLHVEQSLPMERATTD